MTPDIVSEPVFGITLTLAAYLLGLVIYRKTKSVLLHPMLTALVLIVAFLMLTGISYESYNTGGQLITFLLGPATVALAIPMYRQIKLLRENLVTILASNLFAASFGVLLVPVLGIISGADPLFMISVVPKSVTTPIAVGIAEQLGGEPSLTVSLTIVHGLLGGMFGPELHRLFRIKSKMARGLTMGMTAHGLGTARALEESEYEGALAGLAIGLMGLFTALTAPLIVGFFI